MRGSFADRVRLVGAVDAITLNTQAHPAWTERIVWPGGDDRAVVRVTGVGDAVDDLELADWARANGRTNRDREGAQDHAVFQDCEPAVGNADEDDAVRCL